jgi:hypothetical protein
MRRASSSTGLSMFGKTPPVCGSRLQARHMCFAVNSALAPEEMLFAFSRGLSSWLPHQIDTIPKVDLP